MENITNIIRRRRSVYPNMYTQGEIPRETLELILENANWAPTHRKTEPWRFVVYQGASKAELGQYLADDYKQHAKPDTFSQVKYDKNIKKAHQSSAIIAICMQRDPDERLPEWEEIAAVSCAVQNMWLTASALGLGSYWSTPGAINRMNDFLQLEAGQRCIGLFYIGTWDQMDLPAIRGPINEKVRWME